MGKAETNKKTEFIKLIKTALKSTIKDKEKAKEYLKERGLDPDKIVEEGLERIKQIELQLKNKKAEEERKKKRDKRKNLKQKKKNQPEDYKGEKACVCNEYEGDYVSGYVCPVYRGYKKRV